MKTTKKNYKLFRKEANKWIKKFGLTGWIVDFCHDDGDEHLAACYTDCENKSALLELKKDWPEEEKISDKFIRLAAFHEVCELLLARFTELAKDRYATEREINIERHTIIRKLESAMFKKFHRK